MFSTNAHNPSFSPLPSPGYRISGKEVEVCDSGSWHHRLCRRSELQLIQSHVAPSHGPPARVLSPLFFPARSLLLPKPHGKREHPKAARSQLSPKPHGPPKLCKAAKPRFKSQHQSSSAAPFPTPPTISYICQHPRILPALLGCHRKSRQAWPRGVEPIICKLSSRSCNQRELSPSYIMG